MSYLEQLKNPIWQRKRLEIMQRDNFTCQRCLSKDKTLNVHHITYAKNKKAWEYSDSNYITFCEDCHKLEHDINGCFNVSFIRFTDKCIRENDLMSCYDYIQEMGTSFKEYFKDYKSTRDTYLKDDVLMFDAIKKFTTFVFCNFYIDDENEIIYIDHFFDAKY